MVYGPHRYIHTYMYKHQIGIIVGYGTWLYFVDLVLKAGAGFPASPRCFRRRGATRETASASRTKANTMN